MGTDATKVASGNVVPMNRQGTSEPARPTENEPEPGTQAPEVVAPQNRQGTSPPAS